MRTAIVVLLVLGLAAAAFAVDTSNTRVLPTKMNRVVPHYGTPDGREGGETVADAIVIGGLPYFDAGYTCDNIDDYDVVCPYSGSTSPDVVYAYTPATDEILEVDLCGSTYDTKVYVLDAGLSSVACNDDYYFDDLCGVYVSYVAATIYAGNTYYIVVDGYGGDCGDYNLAVTGTPMVPVECPADAVAEGEPDVYDGYVDATNGGCNSTPNVYGDIDWINADPLSPFDGQAWMCGRSGWYVNATGGNSRDTDWFMVTAAESGSMEYMLHGEQNMYMFVLNTDCENLVAVAEADALANVPTTLSWDAVAGTTYLIWAGPAEFTGPVDNFTYYMRITGNMYNTVPNEDVSFSGLKTMFR
ncbi:MAG TPA: hypothetical protein P5571_08705 [Candidatus Krumholzibacteria bacterium]|nr:hypothetical protein [Candidatus Krumholzibacteria bacterium]HRX51427.1 hypothetical protein [Candidatus Krumholzibacteria bacterium]